MKPGVSRVVLGVEVVSKRDVHVALHGKVIGAVQHRGEVGVGPALGNEADREPGGWVTLGPEPCLPGVAVVGLLAERGTRPSGEHAVVGMADDHDFGRGKLGDLFQQVHDARPPADWVELLGDIP
jgi:hypothetical protein